MGFYSSNYLCFPANNQPFSYPVLAPFGSPIYPEFNQPNQDFSYFANPSPLQYRNYCLNQEQSLQLPQNPVQQSDSDQELGILSCFDFAFPPDDETAILDLAAEGNYPIGNQIHGSDYQGLNFNNSRFGSASEGHIQESDHRSIESGFRFAPVDDTAILYEEQYLDDDGNLVDFSSSVPVDRSMAELLQWYQELEDRNHRDDKDDGLSEAMISEHLKMRNYQTVENQEEAEICAVCQCEYENGDTIGTLVCRHEFHADCIKKWLIKKNVCPFCKHEGIQVKN